MKASSSRRAVRMGDQIMREVATLLVEEVQDPRLQLVTLSGVRMNANLRIAEMFYTVSGDIEHRREVQQGLEKATGFLRSNLGKRLKLQFTPELRFTFDDFLEDVVYAKPDASR
ncbi:MAG: 30S ribosome-binding factor RbfA [Pseudodesulfovibrio sp.]|uniref:Ribosome-binding factor A n=1 Tax=Pseudodesulfovibrio aespoeensis (strain ATCC 700646 / DSM 10631 / Aspo-2) TaxID=643562 RepID=E6VSQ9_PSEA9|nr:MULTISPECIES: 30S ribosome-binding factor RbfA [Pseudodesulfovibrio]MBU4191952.1 30S ribosome-binding factor RbfA [Pseudomonadota bacterium]ADU63153.1 ribosome-binding factor A [Pseudodesulfovibrio aespoeensis Aspo-2]MBU4243031.1 30S ribosome-binding factor RbfA [Pseudomonadota bacterium]MBU4379532.1 30S ribosome-binding factor RbfA [Pseudomonadota bacterium]MBU4475950.1 30S ribosome-binding factor RbfA [Pseudomonadota bacterium]